MKLTENTLKEHTVSKLDTDVQLRQVPYPYQAMLAICSDLDETPDRHVYWEIMRFLNTTEDTAMGPGVGIEVGNSIYFDMPANQFAYWNTDDHGREMVRTLIQSGHLDCLHSYGDLATTRKHVEIALNELNRHNCKLEIWIDHGTAPTNFGSDIMQGHGDISGHEAYHADLTIKYGIKYIWRGRVTSIIGQDIPVSFEGIFNRKHPLASSQTFLKEVLKRKLARLGSNKYSMHETNETIQLKVLRDNRPVYEFIRCNPHWGGVSSCDQGRNIENVITDDMLEHLIDRGGTCILYTHLGKIDNPKTPFNHNAVKAFHHLAQTHREGKILVTTTRRLLGYLRTIKEITFNTSVNNKGLCIELNTQSKGDAIGQLHDTDLNGLTFYVSNPEKVKMKINGKIINNINHNPSDHTGRSSVSLARPALEFPEI